MTREEIYNEINVLDNAKFFYKGEIYGDDMTESIGYIPDLAYHVGQFIGLDLDNCSELSDYLQIDVEEELTKSLKRKKIKFTTEDWMEMYAKAVKNLLIYLTDMKENS